jgi:hypothetical protein
MSFEKQLNSREANITKNVNYVDFEKIIELKENSNFFVREKKLKELESEYQGKLNKDYNGKELVELGVSLFKELRDDYGIDLPASFFVSKDEDGNSLLYLVVDKIKPVVIDNEEASAVKERFHQLYKSLSKYYLAKLRNGGSFLTDINGFKQYIYGIKTKEEGNAKIYLVDPDIYLDDRSKSLLTVVYWFCRHYPTSIDKSSEIIENIREFVNEYQKKFQQIDNQKDIDRLEQIKDFLQGRSFGSEILPAIPTFEDDNKNLK